MRLEVKIGCKLNSLVAEIYVEDHEDKCAYDIIIGEMDCLNSMKAL